MEAQLSVLQTLSRSSLKRALRAADYTDEAIDALIRAVNTHEELIAILQQIHDQIEEGVPVDTSLIRAAIAEAKGQI